GSLSVKVGEPEEPTLELELNAIFGRTEFRYWYVDGMLELADLSIPLIPGVVDINGFGGGAYYHMQMAEANLIDGGDGSLGTLPSGIRYEPNVDVYLGLKASVALTSPPGPELLDGVATLELSFGDGFLREIMFYGKIEIVSPKIDQALGGLSNQLGDRVSSLLQDVGEVQLTDAQATDAPVGSILGSLFLRLNFVGGFELQGTARVKIDAAQGVIKGEGGIDLLVSTQQNRWHLYVGGYTDNSIYASDNEVLPPINVSLDLGPQVNVSAGVYFLVGNDIPGPPPLHPQAAAYFGVTSSTANNRASLGNRAALGSGFAFGAYIVGTAEGRTRDGGSYDKNSFKAEAGAGFDVSLLHYKRTTRCSLTGTSPHGHKGWRATGNIWAYADIRAKYRGFGKHLSVGVLIRADIPKPVYLHLTVKIKFPWPVKWITIRAKIGNECGIPVNY
ncbi:MAG: hypothetical protein AAFN92_04890, partial [Bacteroidota bacterium]